MEELVLEDCAADSNAPYLRTPRIPIVSTTMKNVESALGAHLREVSQEYKKRQRMRVRRHR